MENTLRDNRSGVRNYILVLLHQDLFQAASPTQPSLKSSRSRESTTSSRYKTIQKDNVQRSVAAVSIVVLLFAAFVAGVIGVPKN